jgi:glutamate N-acetyltransferase/amino-acid N-acetyltransferase
MGDMQTIQEIPGGVTAAKGFRAAGIHAGIRKNKSKLDLAMIAADTPCPAAAVYTCNAVKADPLLVTREHLHNGTAQAVIVNSGNANACAPDGRANSLLTCREAARVLGISESDVLAASTGVIGQRLPVETIIQAIPELTASLSYSGSALAAKAIMTTDTIEKETAVSVDIGGKTVTVGGIAKGSGMIAPNMGTMLAFITTDCAAAQPVLQKALTAAADKTFNRVVVDGDTSTNDMAVIMASGCAGNRKIIDENGDYRVFADALYTVCRTLAVMIAADGEGATKQITVCVKNAGDEKQAVRLAKSVITSPLVKTAMFGRDANWGRVICALGYSGVSFDPDKTDIAFASGDKSIAVCRNGVGLEFNEREALDILSQSVITINVNMNSGHAEAEAFGCDLTYDYVKINGDYRT